MDPRIPKDVAVWPKNVVQWPKRDALRSTLEE